MNEENKQPQEETSQPDPEQETKSAPEPETEEKSEKKAKKKKEKYTFNRWNKWSLRLSNWNLSRISLSARLQSMKTTASAPPRRRKAFIKMPRQTPSRSSWRCMTIWNGPPPRAAG